MKASEEVFVGRVALIDLVRGWYSKPIHKLAINFNGIGGVGKSELAKQIKHIWADRVVILDVGKYQRIHTPEQVLKTIANGFFSIDLLREYHKALARINYEKYEDFPGFPTPKVNIGAGATIHGDVIVGTFIKANKSVTDDERERRLREHEKLLFEKLAVYTQSEPCIVIFDHFEALENDLEFREWLINTFLSKAISEMSIKVGVLFFSRLKIGSDPHMVPIQNVTLPNLSKQETVNYLQIKAIPESLHELIFQLTNGHPYSLFLTVDLVQSGVFQNLALSPDLLKAETEELLVVEFLIETIMDHVPPAVKGAMLGASVLRIVNAVALADLLRWELTASIDMIHELERRAFLTRVSEEGYWVFHDLLRDLLLKNLRKTASIRGYEKMHRNAIAYYKSLEEDEDINQNDRLICLIEPFYHYQEINEDESWEYFESIYKPLLDRREKEVCKIFISQIDFSKIRQEKVRAWFYFRVADFSREFGNYQAAVEEYLNLLKEYIPRNQINDARLITSILNNLGWTYLFYEVEGHHDLSIEYSNQALEYARRSGLIQIAAMSLNNLGIAWNKKGDIENAKKYYHESLAITECEDCMTSLGSRLVAGMSRQNLGELFMELGNFPEAMQDLNQALSHYQYVRSEHYVHRTIMIYGRLLLKQQEYQQAIRAFQIAIKHWNTTRDFGWLTSTLFIVGICHEQVGELQHLFQAHAVACQASIRDSIDHHQRLVGGGIVPFMLYLYVKRGKDVVKAYCNQITVTWNTDPELTSINEFEKFLSSQLKLILKYKYYVVNEDGVFHKVDCETKRQINFEDRFEVFKSKTEIDLQKYKSCKDCV